jgi:hypothetical protein
MKVPHSSPLSLSTHFLALDKEGPMGVKFYRSLSRLLACILGAVSMYVTTDSQTPGQNINCLGLTTEDQRRWGPAGGNCRKVGLFYFHFNFRRAS